MFNKHINGGPGRRDRQLWFASTISNNLLTFLKLLITSIYLKKYKFSSKENRLCIVCVSSELWKGFTGPRIIRPLNLKVMNMKPNCHINTITKLYARGGREGRKSIAAIYAAFVCAHVFGDTCKEHLVGSGLMVTHTLQPIAMLIVHFIFLCFCILFIYVFIASRSQPVRVA